MGVKSTTVLKREAAEDLYLSLKAEQKTRKWKAQAVKMTDSQLEDELERLNDATYADGSGYDNYVISEYEDDGFRY